ncbi:hypothetical protein [Labrys wisconsinensis]|uniref:Uncharacterized protein n=1 Tax=Labrys wisconsinensis TaxID=425677 RepID=A0ABU0J6U5_9HYPH|nr:hypothetical protein [Labrys wisconsinensis]MDQ0469991.1 hypothetical protein [Labrys wisconsinensis]
MGRIVLRLDVIRPSPGMAVTARAIEMRSAGIDVVGSSAGEPDCATPPRIAAAVRAKG